MGDPHALRVRAVRGVVHGVRRLEDEEYVRGEEHEVHTADSMIFETKSGQKMFRARGYRSSVPVYLRCSENMPVREGFTLEALLAILRDVWREKALYQKTTQN